MSISTFLYPAKQVLMPEATGENIAIFAFACLTRKNSWLCEVQGDFTMDMSQRLGAGDVGGLGLGHWHGTLETCL